MCGKLTIEKLKASIPLIIQVCAKLTIQDMHAFNFTALACNSCAGWVGGAGNLIAVPAVNSPRTKY